MPSVCIFDAKSFQSEFRKKLGPLWKNNLQILDDNQLPILITDTIRKKYLASVITKMGENYNIDTSNLTEAKDIIMSLMKKWLSPTMQLEGDMVLSYLTSYLNKGKNNIPLEDVTTGKLEKLDEKEEIGNKYDTNYLELAYGSSHNARVYAKALVNNLIINSCIIRTDAAGNRFIIQNDKQLNAAIREKQQQLLEQVVAYLKFKYGEDSDTVKNNPDIFVNPKMYNGENYTNILEAIELKFGGDLSRDSFTSDVLDKLFIDKNNPLAGDKLIKQINTRIDGYNAWVFLNNFEDIFKSVFGKAIYINPDYPVFTTFNKFSMNTKGSNVNSTWRTSDEIWLEKEVNNIVLLLVNDIDYIKYDGNSSIGKKLRFNEFAYIICKIKDLAYNIYPSTGYGRSDVVFTKDFMDNLNLSDKTERFINGKTFSNILNSIRENPQEYVPALFELLDNSALFDKLTDLATGTFPPSYFTKTDRDFIHSVNEAFFNTKNENSLYSISVRSKFRSGNANYLAYVTLVVDSMFSANYLQYYRDTEGNIYVRSMYDQGIDNIRRTIEQNITSINSKRITDFKKFEEAHNVKVLYKAVFDKDGKLTEEFMKEKFPTKNAVKEITIQDFKSENNGINGSTVKIKFSDNGEVESIKLLNSDGEETVDVTSEITKEEIKNNIGQFAGIQFSIKNYSDSTHPGGTLFVKQYTSGNQVFLYSGAKRVYNKESKKFTTITVSGEKIEFDFRSLKSVLPFIDKILQLNFTLNKKYLDAFINQPGIADQSDAINKLMDLASHVILNQYISNNLLVNNEGEPLTSWHDIKAKLEKFLDSKKIPTFNKLLGEINLVTNADVSTLLKLAVAKALTEGLITASLIKDGSGNAVPTNTLSRLIGSVRTLWELLNKKEKSASKNFLIFRNGVVKQIYAAKELKDAFLSSSKSHLEFTSVEMETGGFLHDFIGGLVDVKNDEHRPVGNGKVAFIPSVNADKGNIGRIVIDLNTPVRFEENGEIKTTSLKDLLFIEYTGDDKKTVRHIRPEGIVAVKGILQKELQSYYGNVQNYINDTWNKVNQCIKEFGSEDPTYKGVEIKYAEEGFKVLNDAYINALSDKTIEDVKSPLEFINEVVTAHNNKYNDNISLIDQTHFVLTPITLYNGVKGYVLYKNPTLKNLQERFANSGNTLQFFVEQERSVLNNLLKSGFKVELSSEYSREYSKEQIFLKQYLQKVPTPDGEESWIDDTLERMVLGKVNIGGNIYNISREFDLRLLIPAINEVRGTELNSYSKVEDILGAIGDENIRLNPMLAAYNTLDYLFSQEWLLSTVGGHFNHPSKIKDTGLFRTTDLTKNELDNMTLEEMTLEEMTAAMNRIRLARIYEKEGRVGVEKLLYSSTDPNEIIAARRYLRELDDYLDKDESSRYNAQNKRNVSMTATMHAFQQNLLNGIPSQYNIAVIDDVYDTQYNVVGDVENGVKPYDGATFVNPFIVYLENFSLGGAKVGTNKKQFVHYYDENTGTGGIIKTAGFGLTNDLIKNSKFYRTMMYNMTHRTWKNEDGTDYVGDINKDFAGDNIEYINDQDVDGKVYFKKGNKYYWLVARKSLGNNQYQRILQEVTKNGVSIGESELEKNEEGKPVIWTVDSNYSLWQFFGGYQSLERKEGDNVLTTSEFSIKAVVTAMNNMGTLRKISENRTYTPNDVIGQAQVYQPLKHSDIHYMPTVGAVKLGAANINGREFYYKQGDLNFFKIHMNQAGIQLDKEHNADDEELSMMTQVISSCAARGLSPARATQLYNALKTLAKLGIKEYSEGFEKYLANPNEETNKDAFQSVIADTIVDALIHQTSNSDFLSLITRKLMEKAHQGKEIKFRDIKYDIPYSDSAVFRKLASTINVALTKSSIKLKVAGVLSVLCPSYDIMKLYGDKKLEAYDSDEDIEKEQKEVYDKINYINNIHRVDLGRNYRLIFDTAKVPEISSIVKMLGENAQMVNSREIIFFNRTPEDYYKLRTLIEEHPEFAPSEVIEDIREGRNLASYNVRFRAGGKSYQIYDLDSVRALFAARQNKASKEEVIQLTRIVQQELKALSPDNPNTVNVVINGQRLVVNKDSIETLPYEVIMPKIFATTFGLNQYDSLPLIKEDSDFFVKRLLNNYVSTIDSLIFDITLKRINGNHIYLVDRNNVKETANFKPKKFQVFNKNGIIYRINSAGEKVYKLAYTQKELNDNPELHQDEIWEYIGSDGRSYEVIVTEKIDRHLNNLHYNSLDISEKYDGNQAEVIRLFNIISQSTNKAAKYWTRSIRRDASNEDTSVNRIRRKPTINEGATYKAIIDARQSINTLREKLLKGGSIEETDLTDSFIRNLYDQGKEIHSSFLESLKIVAARIPAQSMQSFMPMKVAAFENMDVNTAYVSTAQVWLQGSDYDIDAVSLAAFAFDKNGKFIGWSNLFNLESPEMLKASKELPFPTGTLVEFNDEQSMDYTPFIDSAETPNDDAPILKTVIQSRTKYTIQLKTPTLMRNFIKLLELINENGVMASRNSSEDTIQLRSLIKDTVNAHNMFMQNIKNDDLVQDAAKNFVMHLMYSIINNPINLQEAQAPIDEQTKPFKKIANNDSPKALDSIKAIPGDFTTKINAIVENQTGKKDVGIGAVGMKSFFALTQYYTYILNNGTEDELEMLKLGRDGNGVTLVEKVYNLLANAYAENPQTVTNDDIREMLKLVNNDDDAALALSAILSLAADNAKDLALAKLNGGTNMLGMYLYGISIGVDFRDISKILMSPIGFTISDMMQDNVFAGEKGKSIQDIFDYFEIGPERELLAFRQRPDNKHIYPTDALINKLRALKGVGEENSQSILLTVLYLGSKYGQTKVIELLEKARDYNPKNDLDKVKYNQLIDFIEEYLHKKHLIYEQFPGTNTTYYKEIKKLSEGAEELKTFGQILHLNQGLYTSVPDSIKLIQNIEGVIGQRQYAIYKEDRRRFYYTQDEAEKAALFNKYSRRKSYDQSKKKDAFPPVPPPTTFNLHEFIHNPETRKIIVSEYNKVKAAFNILDAVSKVPHFFSYLEVADMAHQAMMKTSAKYRAVYNLGKVAIQEIGARTQSDKENVLRRTENWVNSYIRKKWMLEKFPAILVKVSEGGFYYDSSMREHQIELGATHTARLGTPEGDATFKRWMESEVIPNLKNGNDGRKVEGEYKSNQLALLNNMFIQALSPVIFTNTPNYTTMLGYSLPINMSPRNDVDLALFEQYKYEFNKLKKYTGITYHSGGEEYDLTELFFYYNQIAFQGRVGENTLTNIFMDSREYKSIADFYSYENWFDQNSDIRIGMDESGNYTEDGDVTLEELIVNTTLLANLNSTNLRTFLAFDPQTSRVNLYKSYNKYEQLLKQEEAEELNTGDEVQRIRFIRGRYLGEEIPNAGEDVVNYFPVAVYANTDVEFFAGDLTPDNRSLIELDNNGKPIEVPIERIRVSHDKGSIISITINGKPVEIPDTPEMRKVFSHIPIKTIFDKGKQITVIDKDTLIDNIITLKTPDC